MLSTCLPTLAVTSMERWRWTDRQNEYPHCTPHTSFISESFLCDDRKWSLPCHHEHVKTCAIHVPCTKCRHQDIKTSSIRNETKNINYESSTTDHQSPIMSDTFASPPTSLPCKSTPSNSLVASACSVARRWLAFAAAFKPCSMADDISRVISSADDPLTYLHKVKRRHARDTRRHASHPAVGSANSQLQGSVRKRKRSEAQGY